MALQKEAAVPMARPVPRFDTDEHARSWLGYGSYVDEHRRILYVQTPKVACSSLKYLMRSLATTEALQFNPCAPESRLAMLVHDRPQIPLPPLTAFHGEQLRDIMTGPGWFRFCVVRHPYERFFSAWRDKVFLCEPGFDAYVPADGRKFVGFTDFVARVTAQDDPFSCDPHWRAQVSLLLPDDIAYTHVYDLAEIGRIPADLQHHLATTGTDVGPELLPRVNQGLPISSDGFLMADILALLRQFYRADFERFGFAEREVTDSPPRDSAELVNEFTDAVFDRNQVIVRHIERARAARHDEEERARHIAELEQMVRHQPFGRDAGIRELEAKIDGLRTMAIQRGQEAETLGNLLEQARAELASLRSECDRLTDQHAAMLTSTSWRMTGPLRRVMSLLRH